MVIILVIVVAQVCGNRFAWAEEENQIILWATESAEKAGLPAGKNENSASFQARRAAEMSRSLSSKNSSIIRGIGWSYKGQIRNEQAHGHGTWRKENGSLHEGQYKVGKKHGFGIEHFNDRLRYEGEFKLDAFDGHGILYTPSADNDQGSIFRGRFKSGKKHGFGIEYKSDGTALYGYWEYGRVDARRSVKKQGEIVHNPSTEQIIERNTSTTNTSTSTLQTDKIEVLDTPYVTLEVTNVRKSPKSTSPIITTLKKNTTIVAKERVHDSTSKAWYLVSLENQRLGYVLGTLIREKITRRPKEIYLQYPNTVAVIIGNRNYSEGLPSVKYAHNDAEAVEDFVREILSVDPDNIINIKDATKANIEQIFGNERNYKGRLWQHLDNPAQSDIWVYYSGHGIRGSQSKGSYLLPADAAANLPEINGYPLDLLYKNLEKLGARNITVLLDACFSGNSHGGELIQSASRVSQLVEEPVGDYAGDTIILTAATGNQVASWDKEAKQGLFTRYFLEAVYGSADIDGNSQINLKEIKEYLDRKMTRHARRGWSREQNAWVKGALNTVLVHLNPN